MFDGALAILWGTLRYATPLLPLLAAIVLSYIPMSHLEASNLYTATDLGILAGRLSNPRGINELGQVTEASANHAFLYTNVTMQDLGTVPDSGFPGSEGLGVNDSDQIVALGYNLRSGDGRAFLLNRNSTIPVVPEPTALVMLSFAAIGLGATRRLRRRVAPTVTGT